MKTIVEDTVAVNDGDEPYTVALEDITQLVQLWRIEHAPVQERVHMMWVDTGLTIKSTITSYVVAVKKQLGIFLNVFHMLFSVFPRGKHYCQVTTLMIFCRLINIIVARNKHKMNNINYMRSSLWTTAGGSNQLYH